MKTELGVLKIASILCLLFGITTGAYNIGIAFQALKDAYFAESLQMSL